MHSSNSKIFALYISRAFCFRFYFIPLCVIIPFMTYQVTATRRRPQRFEDLLGQDFVAATLQKSIQAGKIAHAYLFSGPRGCGKTSSARILAKALNCESGPAPTPCGTCTACTEITAGSSLDVIEIDGASNTSVNDMRQIKDEILFPPNASRYKIYIIDEVHMLSTSAFNALLKTIEEPPPYVIFIFATTELHKVPATIKSRCQQFNFKLVSVEQLKEALAQAAMESGIQADDEALYWIANEATGSVRDAYTLFDQIVAFSDGHITFEKIQEKLGLTGVDSIGKLLTACVEKNSNTALLLLDEILQNGISVEQFVVDSVHYFRSLLFIKQGITKEALIGQRADRFPAAIVNGWSVLQIERGLSLMLELFKDIRFSVDPRYELELAVSRLSWLSDYVSPVQLKQAFEKAAQMLKGEAASATLPQKKSPAGFSHQQTVEPHNSSIQSSGAAQGRDSSPFRNAGGVQSVRNSFTEEDTNVFSDARLQTAALQESDNLARTIDCKVLKDTLVDRFQTEQGMLSAALAGSDDWESEDSVITIFVKTGYEISMLNKNKRLLSDKASELLNQKVSFQIKLLSEKQEKPVQAEDELPTQVLMIKKLLKGKVLKIQQKPTVSKSVKMEEEE